LDSKFRLVLPLEIRDFLGLDRLNRKIILKVFKDNDSLFLKLEKPKIGIQAKAYSKNVSVFNEVDIL